MASGTFLVTAAVMGALLVGVVVVARALRAWRQATPTLGGSEATPLASVGETDTVPALFMVLVLASVGATIFAFDGGGIVVLLALLALGIAAFLTAGVYLMGRSHGHPFSHAVGEAVIALAALGLVAVVGWLLYTAGA